MEKSNFKKPKPITVNGKYYESMNKACKEYNIDFHKVKWRLDHKWSIEEAFGIVSRDKFELNGKKYKSLLSLYNDNKEYLKKINKGNIYYKKIINRTRSGWTYKEAIGVEPRKKKRKDSKSITVEGVTYNSYSEAARAYNLNYSLVHSRLNLGWSIERTFNLEQVQDRIDIGDIILEGVKYKSIAAAARAYNMIYSKVLWRLKHGGQTLEEAFELVPTKRKAIYRHFYNNKYYSTYRLLYDDYSHIKNRPTYSVFLSRLRSNWSIDEALGIKIHIPTNTKRISPIIRGVQYKSVYEAIVKLELKSSASQIYLDIKEGKKSVEEIFEYMLYKKEKKDENKKR